MAKNPKALPVTWKNRIISTGLEDASKLVANPKNWRLHPDGQRDALAAVLDQVGWVQNVIINQRTGFVVDGHLRVSLAAARGEEVPVSYVDLSEAEEALILATFDRVTELAGIDQEKLDALVAEAVAEFPDLEGVLSGIDAMLAGEAEEEDGKPAQG